jgi:hypothetical protein
MITNAQTGTSVREIADGIYRINTPVDLPDCQAFNFNQYLLVDDEPLLFRSLGAGAPCTPRTHRRTGRHR